MHDHLLVDQTQLNKVHARGETHAHELWDAVSNMEVTVQSKIVSCLLLASFFIGCYSPVAVSKNELKGRAEQADIIVVTKDSVEYTFLKDNYRIQGDTLSGSGKRSRNASTDIVLDARLSFDAIASIETSEFNLTRTAALCAGAGVVGVLVAVILSRSSEPAAIVVGGY
jgi:hypothetical protein